MRLRLAPGNLHYWDPKTRLNLWDSTRPEATVPDDADLSNIRLALATGVLVKVDVASPPAETEEKLDSPHSPQSRIEEPPQDSRADESNGSQPNEQVDAAETHHPAESEPDEDGESQAQGDAGVMEPGQPGETPEPEQVIEEAKKEPEKPKKQRKKGGRKKKQD